MGGNKFQSVETNVMSRRNGFTFYFLWYQRHTILKPIEMTDSHVSHSTWKIRDVFEFFKIFMSNVTWLSVISMGSGIIVETMPSTLPVFLIKIYFKNICLKYFKMSMIFSINTCKTIIWQLYFDHQCVNSPVSMRTKCARAGRLSVLCMLCT